ncbi:hypothetical protein BaRGS_00003277 [Batillaria attramentaria]|uniref:Amino acid transporter n=1 Tax=Batillaria attramentaria TaxID=370345 RepID=A0ABD0M1D5_9CAEN
MADVMDSDGSVLQRVQNDVKTRSCLRRYLEWDGCLVTSSMAGVLLGFAVGFTLYYVGAPGETLVWIGLPGELYMRMLKAAVLPLVICSIITGTASLKPKENGRVTLVCLSYMIITNVIGAVIGTLIAVIVRPGNTIDGASEILGSSVDTGNLQPLDLFADLIRNLIPDNLVSACFQKSQTRYREKQPLNTTNSTEYERYLGTAGGTNILGLVISCAVVGMAAAHIEDEARPFLNFFRSATDVMLCLVQWLIMFTPIGAASLIAKSVGGSSDIAETFRGVGMFVLAESVGNLVLCFVLTPVLYVVFIRQNPLTFLASCARPVIAVAVPPSSAVGIPEMLTCLETRYGVDSRVSRFVVPLLASLNRDGSAMFMAVTSVYIAQIHGIHSAGTLVLLTLLVAVGSLAVPAIPSSSVITALMILDSMDIPPANIGIIIALEWYSDRFRTGTNGFSHIMGGVITWRFCRNTLDAAVSRPAAGLLDTDLAVDVDARHNELSEL